MDIKKEISRYQDHAVELRRVIHAHPELSSKEFETTKLIRSELESYGISIRDCGLPTGLIAEIKGTKVGSEKVLAIRADIDALPVEEKSGLPFASSNPGICHACGHDLHTASLLLAARILNEHTDEFSGIIRLLFQPAEESGAGARLMLQHGAMDNPCADLVLGVHTWPDTPAGSIGIRDGVSHASSDTITIKVKGKGGHGAHPYRCVDPVIVTAYLLTQLQTIISRELPMVEAGVLTFGSIHGGTAANVIPDEVVIEGTLRTMDAGWRLKIIDSIKRISASCCEAMKATAEVAIKEGMPVLKNTSAVVKEIKASASKIIGADHVFDLPTASPGSDDFACYLSYAPGALFRMGTGNGENPSTHIGLHNGGIQFDETGIPTAAAVMVSYILDTLQ